MSKVAEFLKHSIEIRSEELENLERKIRDAMDSVSPSQRTDVPETIQSNVNEVR